MTNAAAAAVQVTRPFQLLFLIFRCFLNFQLAVQYCARTRACTSLVIHVPYGVQCRFEHDFLEFSAFRDTEFSIRLYGNI